MKLELITYILYITKIMSQISSLSIALIIFHPSIHANKKLQISLTVLRLLEYITYWHIEQEKLRTICITINCKFITKL